MNKQLNQLKKLYLAAVEKGVFTFETEPECGNVFNFSDRALVQYMVANKIAVERVSRGASGASNTKGVCKYKFTIMQKDTSKVYNNMKELVGLKNDKYQIVDPAGKVDLYGSAEIRDLNGKYLSYLSNFAFFKVSQFETENTLNRFGFGHIVIKYV